MAISNAAKKAVRKSRKRRIRNLPKKAGLKKILKEIKILISQKKSDEANNLLSRVYKSLDKAVKCGIIKKNTASRKKSRIAKALSKTK